MQFGLLTEEACQSVLGTVLIMVVNQNILDEPQVGPQRAQLRMSGQHFHWARGAVTKEASSGRHFLARVHGQCCHIGASWRVWARRRGRWASSGRCTFESAKWRRLHCSSTLNVAIPQGLGVWGSKREVRLEPIGGDIGYIITNPKPISRITLNLYPE